YITRNDQLNIQRNLIMMNPLGLLARVIRYETSGKKLTSVKCDMIQLKRLFAKICGYMVISAFDKNDNESELLTLERLNETLHLIYEDIIISTRFTRRPKIIIQNCIESEISSEMKNNDGIHFQDQIFVLLPQIQLIMTPLGTLDPYLQIIL
ncbi:hypothetical protein RFI_36708, partial [Reticulomyxa filosa]